MARDYRNIKAWQLADKLVKEIYKITKDFPREELYNLISQLRRASVSIPTNIVEGASRNQKKDYLRFLYISRGSLAEVGYLLGLSHDLGYIDNEMNSQLDSMCVEVGATLFGLIKAVESEIIGHNL